MFENDNWDIDEDYLNDFNADAVLEGLQNEKEKNTQKSQKDNYEVNEKSFVNSPRFEFNSSAFGNSVSESSTLILDATSGKSTVLSVLQNRTEEECLKYSQKNVTNNVFHASFRDQEEFSDTKLSTTDCRKNLILNVFQDNEINSVKNDISKPMPTVKSVLKISEPMIDTRNNLKRKKNVAFSEFDNDATIAKKACPTRYQVPGKSGECSVVEHKNQSEYIKENNFNKSIVNDSRKQMLVNLLKSPTHKNSRAPIKQAVIRKFPGPAGLIPDDIEDGQVIDLDSLDENRNDKNNFNKTSVCSQNTKNLFTTGGWQLMLDDLPADFELHDIATIKQNALEYNRMYKKVPYLAGIVHYIDYKPNDPHVILKDLSGKIDAHIHYTVCKLYPNALGTNVVILVKDVGLIVTSKKYVCVIINPKNLISIYSDEARLVETPHLESLMDHNYNLNQSQISIIDEIENQENNKNRNQESASKGSNKIFSGSKLNINAASIDQHTKDKKSETRNVMNNQSNSTQKTKFIDHVDDTNDFQFDEDDSWLGVNIDDLNSFKANQFPSSTPMDINLEKLENENSKQENKSSENSIAKQSRNISKTLKNYVCQKKVKPILKTSDSPSNHLNINYLKIDSNDNSSGVLKTKDTGHSVEKSTDHNQSLNSNTNRTSKKFNSSSISAKMKLSAFRHKDSLTQPSNEEKKEPFIQDNITNKNVLFRHPDSKEQCVNKDKGNIKNSTANSNKQFDCDENDTDDEILSQLDVDAIAASFDE